MKKIVFKSFLLLVASLVISVGLLELGLRIFTPHPIDTTSGKIDHPQLKHTMDPALEEIDEDGFRNQGNASADIIAIGDSHTYGWHVSSEESWPKILGKRLNRNVYNMGVGGFGLLQYHYLLEQSLGREPQPKIILLALFLPNDLGEMCNVIHWSPYWESWASTNNVDSGVCAQKLISPYSNFGVFLRTNLAIGSMGFNLFNKYGGVRKVSGISGNGIFISTDTISTTVSFDYIDGRPMDRDLPQIAVAYDVLKKLLTDTHTEAEARDIFFAVLLLPSKVRVMYRFLPTLPSTLAMMYQEAVFYENRLNRDLTGFLTAKGIPFRDLRPDMEAAVETTQGIYPRSFDDHPTAVGNQVYAEGAYRLLSEHGRLGNKGF